jgi:tRNA nucleotidyltransferase (CCA-adding enzyme)
MSYNIIKKLCKCGHDAYIVGGAVRDIFLGIKFKDVDIVTSATPDEIIELFSNRKVKTVGKSFNVVLVDGIEVATYRHDKYNGLSSKNVEISFAETLEEDLSRRDLTVNSLAFCQYTGDIVDPFNGREDLKNKIIRFTGDPKQRIYEDPDRIIRACRFLAKLNGTFENKTYEALKEYSHLIKDHVSPERIRMEILKAMSIPKASLFFHALHDIGALQYIFPSLNSSFGLDHGKYHSEDIGTHLLLCGDNISNRCVYLKLSGYLHDIGKVQCFEKDEEGDISFKGHDKIGANVVKTELQNLKFSIKEVNFISNLVKLHMRNYTTPKSIRKFLRVCDENKVTYRDVLRLRIADRKANLKRTKFNIDDIKDMLNRIEFEQQKEPPNKFGDLKINGNEVMEITGLKPGKEVGKILKYLLDQVTDDPDLNNYETLKQKILDFMEV